MLSYDTAKRLQSVRTGAIVPQGDSGYWAPVGDYELAYDGRDRIASVVAKADGVTTTDAYLYDAVSRLTSWSRNGATTTYAYDPAGNMTTRVSGGVTTTYARDADDRREIATVGGAATTYLGDALGRRISRAAPSGTTAYTWDAVGHLSSVIDPGSGVSAAYTYGASGMREAKSVTQGGVTTTTRSLWAGGVLLAEKDGDGTLLTFAYGPGGLPLAVQVARSSETTTYAYHTDAFGSVVALSDGSGAVVARYSYDPWGSPTSVTGSNAWLAARQPLRYRGYYFDTETALFYLPARYYDPALGRFLSCDPASPSAGNPLSLNAYAYCQDNPVNAMDSDGREPHGYGMCDDRGDDGYNYGYNPTTHTSVPQAQRKHGQAYNKKAAGKADQRSYRARERPAVSRSYLDVNITSCLGGAGKTVGVTCGLIVNQTRTEGAGNEGDYHLYIGIAVGTPGTSGSVTLGEGRTEGGGARYVEAALSVLGAQTWGSRTDDGPANPFDFSGIKRHAEETAYQQTGAGWPPGGAASWFVVF